MPLKDVDLKIPGYKYAAYKMVHPQTADFINKFQLDDRLFNRQQQQQYSGQKRLHSQQLEESKEPTDQQQSVPPYA